MAEARECLSLPLVSVIIDNYNFGRYLKDATDFVFAQTYPNIECIIVDDASTDESPRILDEIAVVRPSVKVIRRDFNGDQIAACLDGFASSKATTSSSSTPTMCCWNIASRCMSSCISRYAHPWDLPAATCCKSSAMTSYSAAT